MSDQYLQSDLAAVLTEGLVPGQQLCLWDNLGPFCFVEDLSPETIDARAGALLASGAQGGGLIFGTSSGLCSGMRPRRIERAHQCVKKVRMT